MNRFKYPWQLAQRYTPKYEEGDLVWIAKPDEIFMKGYKKLHRRSLHSIQGCHPQSTNIQPYRCKQRYN